MEKPAGPMEAAGFALKERAAVWHAGDPIQSQVRPREVEAREQPDDYAEEDGALLNGVARTF
eukprot:6929920-Pyramimonas_sp.AAC.1